MVYVIINPFTGKVVKLKGGQLAPPFEYPQQAMSFISKHLRGSDIVKVIEVGKKGKNGKQ